MRPTDRSSRAVLSALACALAAVAASTPDRVRADPAAGGYTAPPAPATAGTGPTAGVLLSRRTELLGRALTFKGTVEARFAGLPVGLERLLADGTWAEVARGTADADGAFRMTWRTDRIGRFTVRAVPVPPAAATAAAAPSTPHRAITVFRPAVATLFGPGLYGRRTACGQRLTRRLQGVAHRTLPCGTRVDLLHDGRTATVPVVDRGPFERGVSWDLTTATAQRLRFTRTGTIGAVRVRDAGPGR